MTTNSNQSNNRKLNGVYPLSYMGVNPTTPPNSVIYNRVPTTDDFNGYLLGDLWVLPNTGIIPSQTPAQIWVLTGLEAKLATWTQIFPATASSLDFITDNGTVMPALGVVNINGAVGGNITVQANPTGSNNMTIEVSGTVNHSIQIGNAGGSLTSLTPGTNGQIPIGSTGANPVMATITAGTGISVANGAGSITITATAGGPLVVHTGSGDATESGGAITIAGGNNISTTGAASTVTVNVSGTTNHALQIGNASGSLTSLSAATDGQIPIGSTGVDPVMATITAGSGISITNGAGSISIASTGTANAILITTFNTPGSFTWTKNAATQYVDLLMWGGGGGGGSGRRSTSTNAGGGGGGGAGDLFFYSMPSIYFSASETVVVGAGGTGGIAQTVNDTDGNNGTKGGVSSLGNVKTGGSTNYGPGGITGGNSGQGGQGYVQFITGGVGGAPGHGTLTVGGDGPNIGAIFSGSAGGGGGGADSVTARKGGNGGNITTLDGGITLVTGGAGGIEGGTINGGNGGAQVTGHGVVTGGAAGGGGGGQSVGGVAGIGGNGAFPGGGGGGGGGSLNGTNSGAGGNGGDGAVWVIEYF